MLSSCAFRFHSWVICCLCSVFRSSVTPCHLTWSSSKNLLWDLFSDGMQINKFATISFVEFCWIFNRERTWSRPIFCLIMNFGASVIWTSNTLVVGALEDVLCFKQQYQVLRWFLFIIKEWFHEEWLHLTFIFRPSEEEVASLWFVLVSFFFAKVEKSFGKLWFLFTGFHVRLGSDVTVLCVQLQLDWTFDYAPTSGASAYYARNAEHYRNIYRNQKCEADNGSMYPVYL